jgi:hypothetical protein
MDACKHNRARFRIPSVSNLGQLVACLSLGRGMIGSEIVWTHQAMVPSTYWLDDSAQFDRESRHLWR